MDKSDSSGTPELATYQARVVRGATRALAASKDVLVEAPTGAGKTAIIGRMAAARAGAGRRVLVLTHRRQLLRQMAGGVDGVAGRAGGEIARWSGQQVGRIADPELGGIDQGPAIVVGMVETAANRRDQLAHYDDVYVDEAHHLSAASEADAARSGEALSYLAVLDALPEARLVGFTATIFRGDGDRLHSRLEAAHREVVAVEEAQAAGRIVPVRTISGRARLENGLTPWAFAESVSSLGDDVRAAQVSACKGSAFYERVAQDWKSEIGGRPTIAFCESVAEIGLVQGAFDAAWGPGVAVPLHGGQGIRTNDRAIAAYASGAARVLVCCKMIDEGFDVPETDGVMLLNASLSRAQMNQYAGRAVRGMAGKAEALVVDYGLSSWTHGRVEDQHRLQNVAALGRAGALVSVARAVGAAMPTVEDGWGVIAGKEQSLFVHQFRPGQYRAYSLDHRAAAEGSKIRRETNRKLTLVDPASRYPDLYLKQDTEGNEVRGYGEPSAFDIRGIGRLVADHLRDEAGYVAGVGGVAGAPYRERCRQLVEHWKGAFKHLGTTVEQPLGPEAARRQQSVARMAGRPTLDQAELEALKLELRAMPALDRLKACLVLGGVAIAAFREAGIAEARRRPDAADSSRGLVKASAVPSVRREADPDREIGGMALQEARGLRRGVGDRLVRQMAGARLVREGEAMDGLLKAAHGEAPQGPARLFAQLRSDMAGASREVSKAVLELKRQRARDAERARGA